VEHTLRKMDLEGRKDEEKEEGEREREIKRGERTCLFTYCI
jgi:hypothetical protein